MTTIPPEAERERIGAALCRLILKGGFPATWIDGHRIHMQTGKFRVERITWQQAARIANGEPVEAVLGIGKGPASESPKASKERCA